MMDTKNPGVSRGRTAMLGGRSYCPHALHSVPNVETASLRLLLSVFLFCGLIGCVLTLEGHEFGNEDHSNKVPSANQEVKRFWGIPDVTAVAGQIFNFTIPNDAFTGKIRQLVVTEAGESSLPSWLHFDSETRMFQGVPMEKNLGQYYISVKAYGPPAPGDTTNGKSVAKDVFSVDVVEDSPDTAVPTYTTQAQKCSSGESLTLATIVLDTDMENLRPAGKAALVEKAAALLKLAGEAMKLKPLGTSSRVFDNSALMAGPGNSRSNPLTAGTLLQWQVGCSGVVSPEHASRISDVEKLSKDGTLADELSVPVIGWHVTNQQPQLSRREKRQASNQIAGTPVPDIFPSRWPHGPTEKIEDGSIEETYAPEIRIVPTMVSPVFFQSSKHPHRHGHGDINRKRPPGAQDTVYITASPVVHQRFPNSPVASPSSTPVPFPDRPSHYPTLGSLDVLGPSRVPPGERTPILRPSMVSPTAVPPDLSISPIITDSVTTIIPSKTVVPSVSPPNFKPAIENRMKKLSMVAGKTWNYTIPEDTFTDFEDGNTRKLKLMFMTAERTSIPHTSWIQFDPVKQVLYALPLEENIGKYEYILEAMDSYGDTSQDRLDIHVWQHPSARAVHHEFTLKLKFQRWKFPIGIDWQIEVVKKLAKVYGDTDISKHITVRSVTTEPITISWTNDTLPRHPCPKAGIAMLMERLANEDSGEITRSLKKTMKIDFTVEEASVSYKGVCQPPSSTTPITREGSPPILRNPIEQINATVGEILRFRVPDDTFFDYEEGSTRYLTLSFLTIDNKQPPESYWVQLDPKSQELCGLPFDEDVGQKEFMIVAIDSELHQVSDVFLIVVHKRIPRKTPVEFSVHLDEDFDSFNRNTSRKVLVAWKLSTLFGDPDPRYITVRSILKGSVVYSWYNNTLPHDPCPTRDIRRLVHYLFNDNDTISNRLVEAMKPHFKVTKADAMPVGVCLSVVPPNTGTVIPGLPRPTPTDDEIEIGVDHGTGTTETSDDDIYLTTIIPAVLIAIMLIIAALVACFLYRKKRKGKMTMQDTSTFTSKGIPIIFSDELDEKADPAKPPIIMKEEKPPLVPASQEYPHSVSASSTRGSTPQVDRKETQPLRGGDRGGGMHHGGNPEMMPMLHHGDPHFSPPYQPPPPFTASREHKNSRPKATPTYRQPPPYVPP